MKYLLVIENDAILFFCLAKRMVHSSPSLLKQVREHALAVFHYFLIKLREGEEEEDEMEKEEEEEEEEEENCSKLSRQQSRQASRLAGKVSLFSPNYSLVFFLLHRRRLARRLRLLFPLLLLVLVVFFLLTFAR